MPQATNHHYLRRARPLSERLFDGGFKNAVVLMASMVAIVLFTVLLVVFLGGLESMDRYGWSFLTTSNAMQILCVVD